MTNNTTTIPTLSLVTCHLCKAWALYNPITAHSAIHDSDCQYIQSQQTVTPSMTIPSIAVWCNYCNGTSVGVECSDGLHACMDLSSDFIANRIGCGSCNAFGACKGLTATSSVGEGSCNGGIIPTQLLELFLLHCTSMWMMKAATNTMPALTFTELPTSVTNHVMGCMHALQHAIITKYNIHIAQFK